MHPLLRLRKDFYGGLVMMAFGLLFALVGRTYRLGTLNNMGPGFFPTALGIGLVFIGIAIAGGSARSGGDSGQVMGPPDLRGGLCIVGGVLAFIVLGTFAGFLPATFACIFIAAIGDRSSTLKGSLVLAGGLSIFGTILFCYLLGVQFPVLMF